MTRTGGAVRIARAGLAAGLGAGLLVAPLDLACALVRRTGSYGAGAFLAGAGQVVLIDLALGAAIGLALAGLAAAVFGWSRFARAARAAGRLAREVATGAAPEREVGRVGALLAAALLAGLVAAIAASMTIAMLPRVALEPALGWPVAGVMVIAAVAALSLFPALARGLGRSLAALPAPARRAVTVRSLLFLAAGLLLAAATFWRGELAWLLTAVGAWPLILLAIAAATAAALLAALAGAPEPRGPGALARPRVLAAELAILAVLWGLGVAGVGQDGPALRVYRADAPLAALAGPWLPLLGAAGPGELCPDDACRTAACRTPPAPPRPAPVPAAIPERLSFVVIMVDALRYDHLHAAGYPRALSPNMDRLAGSAIVFEQAYAPSAYTQASVSAIMTSRFPSDLPGALHKKAGIPAGAGTLARSLAAAGYQTLYLSDYGPEIKNARFEAGFADHRTVYDDGAHITELALEFLDRAGDRPFLLWATYFGPHAPYQLHDGVPRFGKSAMDLYDGEIASTDRLLGPLLARLDRPALRDRVAVVLLSDHGEAFGEHGTYNHGHNLHQENVHVPLLLRVPGAAPRRLAAPVSALDLAPTLLNLARLPVPPDAVGHDLTAAVAGGELPPERAVFIESDYKGYPFSPGYQAAVVVGRHKLVVEDRTGSTRLFDLEADPDERRDLAPRMPDVVCELMRLLRRYRGR